MSYSNGNSKRVKQRYNAVFKVEYDSYKNFLVDYTENISEGGTFIITRESFTIGEKFKILISFPKIIKSIPIDVEVMWLYEENFDDELKKGIGVKFLFNDEYHKKKFNKLIEIISKKYQEEKENKVIKALFYSKNRFINSSFIDTMKNINNMDKYKNINFVLRNTEEEKDILLIFLEEEFSIVILDTKSIDPDEIISDLKRHKDKVIYIGLGDKKSELLDFHLTKPFTTSKIEALLNMITKASQTGN